MKIQIQIQIQIHIYICLHFQLLCWLLTAKVAGSVPQTWVWPTTCIAFIILMDRNIVRPKI